MKKLLLVLPLLVAALACTLGVFGARSVSSLYCKNFLIYDMCAQNLGGYGVVEHVYSEDSGHVFIYRKGTDEEIATEFVLHPCTEPMDEELIAITSRVFYVNEETTHLGKQDIRGAMMLKYISYIPRIATCNLRNEWVESDEFSS
tara:strand:- start:85 stop:519 length:435 start_codon:yes stop_codon:yes gene_type:complete